MPSSQGEPSRDRTPDPAALAQGHRLWRAAGHSVLVVWLCGSLGLMWIENVVVMAGIALLLVLAWLRWGRNPTTSTRAKIDRDPRLPDEIHGLLELVDGLVESLERGKDRQFNLDIPELGRTLDELGPASQRYLDERRADRGRLRHGVCGFDPEAKLDAKISADRRRALHGELLRFAAAARGRPCGDPYRMPMSDEGTVLAASSEPALARVRRRLAGLLLLVGVGWVIVSQTTAALGLLLRRACGSWVDAYQWCTLTPSVLEYAVEYTLAELAQLDLDLGLALEHLDVLLEQHDPHVRIVFALALVPMFLLVIAPMLRAAAWRSWASALPDPDEFPSAVAGRLARARRCERAARWLWRGLTWLACGFTLGLMLAADDWSLNMHGHLFADQIFAIEFVTLAFVAISTMTAKLERRREQRWMERRIARAPGSAALLTELFELRREIEHAPPVRADLLEQLADALERANVLNRLSTDDRDRVVARLRAGAARAPAIGRELQAELLLDVCGFERLISCEIKPANQGSPAA